MRHARLTWIGAYHHIMNRGLNGEAIFKDDKLKTFYLSLIEEEVRVYKIRIFTYCIMDTHFHLVLENTSGKLSEFMKAVNGQYGKYYRKLKGGRGYVFQDRFRSTLIEDDNYLKTAIIYILHNPVRAELVKSPEQYKWSSTKFFFNDNEEEKIIDKKFVIELFGTPNNLQTNIHSGSSNKLEGKKCKFGYVMGSDEFIKEAIKKYDRRNTTPVNLNKRIEDKYFEPVEKIIYEYEKTIGKKIEAIDTTTIEGKRQRGEFLFLLKDLGGLKYSEIFELPVFSNIRFNSLSKLYRYAKNRKKKMYG